MEKSEFIKRYIKKMISYNIDATIAASSADAIYEEWVDSNQDDTPEDCVAIEMSYWTE